MNRVKTMMLLVSLCLIFVGLASAQINQSVKIYATDGVGYDSVLIGIHSSATGGIDAALGEAELPPAAPTFDFRSVTMVGYDNLAGGAKVNYHAAVRATQKDVYKFQFKSDPDAGGNVVFSWPANMGSLYGGYWRLLDFDGSELCDMTAQTSFTYPINDPNEQYVMIVKGDGVGYLTATVTALETAADYKGKVGKSEKRKPLASEGEYHFTNSSAGIDALYIEFSQEVAISALSPFDKMTNADGKKKKWTFEFTSPTDTLPNGATVEMFAIGNKGKELTAKAYWWIPAVPPVKWKATKLGPVTPFTGTSRLRLNMPNWNNVGDELFLTDMAFPAPNGLVVGLPFQVAVDAKLKPIYRYVIHPKKYSTVWSALAKKGSHIGGAPVCLSTYGGKPVVKPLKGMYADKGKNELYAALMTLKFNIASSKYAHTGPGFGNLLYVAQSGDPAWANDLNVDTVVAIADNFFSCYNNKYHISPDSATGTELLAIINTINGTFAGTFDTLSFGVKTVVKPPRYLVDVADKLYRTTLAVPEQVTTPGLSYDNTTPVEFQLHQNFPNPFNPTTNIAFDLSADALVSLKVYNMLGQEVATILDNQEFTEGNNEVSFDASALASGVYYYRLIVNDGELQQVMKMMLLK